MKDVLNEISSRMRTHSVPWHTAGRYWGHMNSETLMPSLLATTLQCYGTGTTLPMNLLQQLLKWKKK